MFYVLNGNFAYGPFVDRISARDYILLRGFTKWRVMSDYHLQNTSENFDIVKP